MTPVPVVTIAPGVLVRFQVPVAGNPFRITLPVANAHVGWVMVPTVGAVGFAVTVTVTAVVVALAIQVLS